MRCSLLHAICVTCSDYVGCTARHLHKRIVEHENSVNRLTLFESPWGCKPPQRKQTRHPKKVSRKIWLSCLRVACVAGRRKGGRKSKWGTYRASDPPASDLLALNWLVFLLSLPFGRLPRRLVYEMLFIKEGNPSLNTQIDSIRAKLFV